MVDKIAWVKWLDSKTLMGWTAKEAVDMQTPLEVFSVGFVVVDDGQRVILVQSMHDSEGLNYLFIPRSSIVTMRIL